VDSVYRPKTFGKKSLFAPAGFEFAINRVYTSMLKDFRATWNKARKETGLGYGYKLNAKYIEKGMGSLPNDS